MMKAALGLKLQTSTPSGSPDNEFDFVTAYAIAEHHKHLSTFTEHFDPSRWHAHKLYTSKYKAQATGSSFLRTVLAPGTASAAM
jgi:hypothetical protein